MSAVVHHAKVGIVARHPFGRGPVGCQHHVEPHRQAVPGREVEHSVVVVEVVRVARRLHPVPVRRAAHDAKPRRTDVGEVLIPELGAGRAAAVVFDADRKRRVGMGKPLGHVLYLRESWSNCTRHPTLLPGHRSVWGPSWQRRTAIGRFPLRARGNGRRRWRAASAWACGTRGRTGPGSPPGRRRSGPLR